VFGERVKCRASKRVVPWSKTCLCDRSFTVAVHSRECSGWL